MSRPKSSFLLLALLFCGACALHLAPLAAQSSADDDFWLRDSPPPARMPAPAFQGKSYVYAGLLGYFNNSRSGPDDENTGGLKISAAMKELSPYLTIRLDVLACHGGPAEGLLEADFTLTPGLIAGLGISHTRRLDLSPRLGLYVEDQKDTSRRGGIFLLEDNSGGLELNWPLADSWSTYGELGIERENNIKYTRILAGVFYKF